MDDAQSHGGDASYFNGALQWNITTASSVRVLRRRHERRPQVHLRRVQRVSAVHRREVGARGAVVKTAAKQKGTGGQAGKSNFNIFRRNIFSRVSIIVHGAGRRGGCGCSGGCWRVYRGASEALGRGSSRRYTKLRCASSWSGGQSRFEDRLPSLSNIRVRRLAGIRCRLDRGRSRRCRVEVRREPRADLRRPSPLRPRSHGPDAWLTRQLQHGGALAWCPPRHLDRCTHKILKLEFPAWSPVPFCLAAVFLRAPAHYPALPAPAPCHRHRCAIRHLATGACPS